MKHKKLPDILFFIGICVILIGILAGTLLGFLTADKGFNLIPSVTTWLLSVITGTGFVTVSGSINEAKEKKQDDEEMLRQILEQIKKDE